MKMAFGMTCIWFIAIVFVSSFAIQDASQLQLGAYQTVTFNIEDGVVGYKTFLSQLRPKFEGSLKACGLPVTRDNLPKGGEYVLVDLKNNDTEYLTVALKVTDLYLIAFRVNKKLSNGKYQAKFLNEPDKVFAKANLFKDLTTLQVDLNYDSNYASIEKFAKLHRTQIPLGINELKKKIKTLFDGNEEPKIATEEARFLLIAIQMVSEAARYSYIEDKVVKTGPNSFKPDEKMITLEKNWQKTSDVVRKAEDDKKCDSQQVKDIKKDTKLLKHKRNKLSINDNVLLHLFTNKCFILTKKLSQFWSKLSTYLWTEGVFDDEL